MNITELRRSTKRSSSSPASSPGFEEANAVMNFSTDARCSSDTLSARHTPKPAAAAAAALVLVALLVMSGLIKPAFKAATATPVGSRLDAVVSDPIDAAPAQTLALASPQSEKTLADARALAKQNPAAVAHIVRDWVSKEAS